VIALDGSFYGRQETSANYVLRRVNILSAHKALREVARKNGGFAGLVAQKDGLSAFRDVNGVKPLYYARSAGTAAFASEMKALWRIGFKNPRAVAPGFIVRSTRKELSTTPIVRFSRPRERNISFKNASKILHRLLSESIGKIAKDSGKICIAFSGGLDSAVTAAMAKNCGVDVEAVSVGIQGSPEVSSVERFADLLGLPITLETFGADSIEEYVRRVVWLIEEPNMMKLSVAIPLHWVAKVATRRGCHIMLCGQGSDELYGGYNKYTTTLRTKGRRGLIAHLYRSVVESSQINYERDDKATSPFPVELRTPFADPDLINFSLAIPSEFKVSDCNDTTRKWILRDVARTSGVPEELVWRRKKAIQHGTGVEKAILKLAKSRGLQPDLFLSKTFEEVRSMESMP
jgi:asparagine synthase (glutamine-hydrolysing)